MNTPILATIRASSWGDFVDCGYRWYWKNIEGLRSPSRGPTVTGSAIHKGTAVYDGKILAREQTSIDEAIQAAVDYVDHPTTEKGDPQEVIYDDDMTKGNATDFAVKLTSKYCREVAPEMNYKAVELKCTRLDITTSYGVIRTSGTVDRVQENALRVEGVVDFKGGEKAVNTENVATTKGHGLQLGIYTLMSEAETKRPMGPATILGFQFNSKLRIGRGVVEFPKRALVGDAGHLGIIEIVAKQLKEGVFIPNPKSVLCTKKWCPAFDVCIYHD